MAARTDLSNREWAEEWVNIPAAWSFDEDGMEIDFGHPGSRCRFRPAHVRALRNAQFPSHPELRRLGHCGIVLGSFAEILVDFSGGGWPAAQPLQFKVGETLVRVGPISCGLALVFEAVYRSKDHWQYEFIERYSSISLSGTSAPEFDAQCALFYLNADYLKPLKAHAYVVQLVDPLSSDAFPPEGDPKTIERKRIRRRERPADIEPVALYNAASAEFDEAQFLGFYRVLEFFFFRGSVLEVGRLRRDTSVKDEELLSLARLDRELPQLKALLRQALTQSEATNAIEYVKHHRLAKPRTLDELAEALYKHRNTLVHAKEAQILDAQIPNPFDVDSATGFWAWIAELCANRAIRRLSKRADA